MSWPDYCSRRTLARRLDIAEGAIDQLVTRGILPAPYLVGEARLWRWSEVDGQIISGRLANKGVEPDPYIVGVTRAHGKSALNKPK